MAMTTYDAKRICPRCPRTQIVRVAFVTAEPWRITYHCTSCHHAWEAPALQHELDSHQ